MSKKDKMRNTGCPVAYALDIFGDRWSLVIIRDILIKGYTTYSQLLNSDEKIATNILATRLKELTGSGIISKKRDPDNGRYVIYKMTSMGADLAPIILEMMRWSGKYDINTKVSQQALNRLENDRQGFVDEIKQRAMKGWTNGEKHDH